MESDEQGLQQARTSSKSNKATVAQYCSCFCVNTYEMLSSKSDIIQNARSIK